MLVNRLQRPSPSAPARATAGTSSTRRQWTATSRRASSITRCAINGYPDNGGLGRQANATFAYYLVGRADADRSFVIQYWYFWTYNYFNVTIPPGIRLFDGDNHEGDLEHVDIRFSSSGRPLRITLSRHAPDQYGHYSWNQVDRVGTHPVVYAAHGDHGF